MNKQQYIKLYQVHGKAWAETMAECAGVPRAQIQLWNINI